MTIWQYVEPGPDGEPVTVTMSEAEILAAYYPWWQAQMRKADTADQISERACIDDADTE